MSTPAMLGSGIYFIDVLACLLFCITLALVGARFGHEVTVPVDLPGMEEGVGSGMDVIGPSISVYSAGEELRVLLEDEPVTMEDLTARLRASPPPSF